MAETIDTLYAFQIEPNDFVLIGQDEVIVWTVEDMGETILVRGDCVSRPDSEYEGELHCDLEVFLLG